MKTLIDRLIAISLVIGLMTSCQEDEPDVNQYVIRAEVSNERTTSAFKYNQQGKITEWESLFNYTRYFYDNNGRLNRSESALDSSVFSAVFIDRTTLMTAGNTIINRYQTLSLRCRRPFGQSRELR